MHQTGGEIDVPVFIVFEIERIGETNIQTRQGPMPILKAVTMREPPTVARATIVRDHNDAMIDFQALKRIAKYAAFITIKHGRVANYRSMKPAVASTQRQHKHVLDDRWLVYPG